MPKTLPLTTRSPSCANPRAALDPLAPDAKRRPYEYNLYLVARMRKVRAFAVAVIIIGAAFATRFGARQSATRLPDEFSASARPRAFSRESPNDAARNDALVFTLDVNVATVAELSLLPSIGPALAQRVVEYRDANGPFQSVDELRNVKGFGVKTLEKIQPYCYVVTQEDARDE